jgi:hypothetical protein
MTRFIWNRFDFLAIFSYEHNHQKVKKKVMWNKLKVSRQQSIYRFLGWIAKRGQRKYYVFVNYFIISIWFAIVTEKKTKHFI